MNKETRIHRARNTIISLDDTPYYHCVARCVRRAFLCGVDHYTGNSYEHRRQWLEEKLHSTAAAFAIKLCSYAVMSNHYHVVLHVRVDLVSKWSDRDVVTRWHSLFSGNLLSQRFLSGEPLSDIQREFLSKDIEIWRARLCDISWYMRIVNEAIARKANAEDQCTGRFWEGRFKSQALLDERALLACLAYVDLNPVRASMSGSPETSDHTCVKQRIAALEKNQPEKKTIESFDFTYLKTQFGDSHKDIFKAIAPTFLHHAYGELEQLKEVANSGNADKVKSVCHSIKGAASSIGLSHLANALLQIENEPNSINLSKHIADVDQIMRELKPLIQKELDALD